MSATREQISDALQWAEYWGRARNNPSREAQYIWALRDAYEEAIEALRNARAQIDFPRILLQVENGKYIIDIIDEVIDKYPEELCPREKS